jgi:hypothetical protein
MSSLRVGERRQAISVPSQDAATGRVAAGQIPVEPGKNREIRRYEPSSKKFHKPINILHGNSRGSPIGNYFRRNGNYFHKNRESTGINRKSTEHCISIA